MGAIGPTLGLRSVVASAGFDFSTGTLPPGASLTRASPASRVGPTRRIETVAADVARFDHDPVDGRRRGLMIEAAATNLLKRSTAPGDAEWALNSASIMPGAAGPDGLASGVTMSDVSTTGFGVLTQNFASGAAALVASLFIAKDAVPGTTRLVLLRLSSPLLDVKLDTASGATQGSAGDCGVEDHGSHWRLWRATSAGAAAFSLYCAVGDAAGGNSVRTLGSADIWGAQVEVGSSPTSYVASEMASGTRAADRLVLDWGRFGMSDGPLGVQAWFDDGSSQPLVLDVMSGTAVVPVLARRHVVRITRA